MGSKAHYCVPVSWSASNLTNLEVGETTEKDCLRCFSCTTAFFFSLDTFHTLWAALCLRVWLVKNDSLYSRLGFHNTPMLISNDYQIFVHSFCVQLYPSAYLSHSGVGAFLRFHQSPLLVPVCAFWLQLLDFTYGFACGLFARLCLMFWWCLEWQENIFCLVLLPNWRCS